MLHAANPSPSLWHGIVPPQLIYARRRYLGVVLQPPNENPGSWTGAGKALYDPAGKRFLLSTRPRKADEGVRGYAAQVIPPAADDAFLTLPSLEDYERRLRQRKTETDTDLKVRLGKVTEEMRSMLIFDYVVVNREDQLDAAVDQIRAIFPAEKCRVTPHVVQFK